MKTKTSKEKPKKTPAENSAPAKGTKKRMSKKLIDVFFLKVSPQVQKQLDQIKGAFEKNPGRVETMKMLGLKILERAKEFSQTMKREKNTGSVKNGLSKVKTKKATQKKTSPKKAGDPSEKKS